MKSFLSIFLSIVILSLSLISCTEKASGDDENITVPKEARFLIGSWERVDEADAYHFNLKKDNGFSFYCDCGNSVGSADCYDTFEYLKDEQIIRAYDLADKECYQDYKLYLYGKNFIIIDVDGVMMEFWLKGADCIPTDAFKHCGELLKDFTSFRYMSDISDTELTLVPPYYDGDIKEHREEKIKLKLASDVKFSSFDVFTVNKDGVETTTYEQGDMTLEEVKYLLDATLGGGFVWLNENLEVTKVLFYGELYNWE